MGQIDYSTTIETLAGESTDLSAYRGKVLLIVNTASQCAFTPQYDGLQALHDKYGERGFSVLGFPCNQFGAQEPGSPTEISTFCQMNFGIQFPMHAKVHVNGDLTHPLFAQLKESARGLLGTRSIKWNFTKFLVGRDGTILKRYASRVKPLAIEGDIEVALTRTA